MENKNNSFLWRLYLISSILLIFGIGIGYKLFYLQFVEGEKYRKIAEDKTLKSFTVNSVRGNIFSEDGSLLATSTTKYDIYFDSKTVSKNTFDFFNSISIFINIASSLVGSKSNAVSKFFSTSLSFSSI